ncbi:hypothetical protein [Parasitella parasitica]|uniref:Centromere protein O n=1 Tax=Parasitella parasitica TaxID=35722 RepID=A0A0B7MVS1_9FUNG|nr:hypothetical protein [Parasitella parasitica]
MQMDMDEDTFLPSEDDKLKARIKEMRRRLAVATIRDKELRKELLEEDLSYITVSSLTALIEDPTRVAKYEFDDMEKEVYDKMMSTADICCIREAISYHRLAGCSVFTFKGNRTCIRLETFYNRKYIESYYIIYEKDQKGLHSNSMQLSAQPVIEHHTIPNFIHILTMQNKYLPGNFDTFIRIVHDQVQAYVTRREILKEVAELKKTHSIEIRYQSTSLQKVEIEVLNVHNQKLLLDISFENQCSGYPTDVVFFDITNKPLGQAGERIEYLSEYAMLFKQRPMVDVLIDLLNTESTVSGLEHAIDMELD